ncbi:alpha/beta hydrolase fold domain-containing protein [Streptomyces sp. NPDC001663]|uniref:alpha/beta hydrolase fold domain-containing protein n=1 Tax=Streptomyces sp. NPDC001663 TaxID=3364597 RepID=UPI0036AEFEA9
MALTGATAAAVVAAASAFATPSATSSTASSSAMNTTVRVKATKDIAYAPAQPAGSQGHLLDLYVPRSERPVPLVIFTSGSAWMADSGRQGGDAVAAQLNPHGFAVAGVSVRSSSQAQFPAQLYDIKGAIRWLRAHAREYNLDSRRFAIMGDSSGGWATAMAAVTGDIPRLEGNVGVSGPSSAVQAALPFYPPTDFSQMDAHMLDNCTVFNAVLGLTDCHSDARSPESLLLGCPIKTCPDKVAAANPLTYVSDRPLPPTLIFHGKQDPLVPYHQGRLLRDALASAGADVRMISLPNAGHGPISGMLGDTDTRRDAYEESAKNGHTTPPRPVTPSWQTIVSFLESELRPAPR